MAKHRVIDTGTAQFTIAYDGSNYAPFTCSSTGDLIIAPTGGDTSITGTLGVSSTVAVTRASGTTAYIADLSGAGVDHFYLVGRSGATDILQIYRPNGANGVSINTPLGPVSINAAVTTGASAGDIVAPASHGFVCNTPDGTKRYRISVDNSGNLTTTLL